MAAWQANAWGVAARATLWLLCNKKPVGVVNIVVTVPGARKEVEAFPEVLRVA